jgi:methyl-accepting chemotaxis protein
VAGEVKALAAQAATAAEEIEAQTSRIQSVTATVGTAIQDDIVTKIGKNEPNRDFGIGGSGPAKRRYAYHCANAQQVASIAVEVVHAIASIEGASATTKIEANQVLDAAGQLSRQSDDLHIEFDKFIANVRSA